MTLIDVTMNWISNEKIFTAVLQEVSIICVTDIPEGIHKKKYDFKNVMLTICAHATGSFCYMSITLQGITKDGIFKQFLYDICKYETDKSVYVFIEFLRENMEFFEKVCSNMSDHEIAKILKVFIEAVKKINDSDMKKTVAKFLLLLKLLS